MNTPRNISKRNINKTALAVIVLNTVFVLFNTLAVFKHIDGGNDVQELPPIVQNTEPKTGLIKHAVHPYDKKEFDVDHKKNDNIEYVSTRVDSTIFNPTNRIHDSNDVEEIIIDAEEIIMLNITKDGPITDTTSSASKKGRYAYNFVLGGIHESEPAYKGFLYNILISVNLLKKLGSEADFWVWAQLSPNSTLDDIPEEDMRLFGALDIKVVEMEKPSYMSFSSLMYDKFRALQKTEYKRFMYLDADILPLVNLDYYFHLSDPDEKSVPTILQPNLNIATKKAPCNGGMFMMHPAAGAWEQLVDTVNRRHEEGRKLPYPHFDYEKGWGHNFTDAGDYWESLKRNGTDWHFYGSHTDQGLWYYYSKYVRKDVSILVEKRIQTWAGSDNKNADLPVKVKEVWGDLSKYSPKPIIYQYNCDDPSNEYRCYPTNTDTAHFMSRTKPWLMGISNRWFFRKNDTADQNEAHRLWFKELDDLNKKLHLNLDVYNWNEKHADIRKRPPFGLKPSWTDNAKDILSHRKFVSDTYDKDTEKSNY